MSATKEHHHSEIEAGQRSSSSTPPLKLGEVPEGRRGITPTPRKESPILFSTPMVKAILEGRKTQTRRLTGLEEVNKNPDHWEFKSKYRTINRFYDAEKEESPNPLRRYFVFTNKLTGKEIEIRCRYGDKTGDLIWVRETWCKSKFALNGFTYKANAHPEMDLNKSWKPSIHMPKVASRIWLEFDEAGMERLQSISEADAKAEGANLGNMLGFGVIGQANYLEGFFLLWRNINGLESLHENPWVWVVKFKVISTTGKENIQ